MRRLVVVALVLLLVGCAGIVANKAQAQEQGTFREVAMERIQDLHLTDAQENKIAEIRKEWRPKIESPAKELQGLLREETEKVRSVLTEQQLDEVKAMRELRAEHRTERLAERLAHLEELDLTAAETAEIAAIREQYRPKIMTAMEGMKGTLTAAQKQAREEGLKAGKTHKEILASLNLTDEQKKKCEAVGKEVRTAMREEMEKIRDVLTPAQQGMVVGFKEERKEEARDRIASAIANAKELNLTADQKGRIAAIRQQFLPEIQTAGTNLRAAVREELAAIIAVLKG